MLGLALALTLGSPVAPGAAVFVLTSTLDGATFTRATTATYTKETTP